MPGASITSPVTISVTLGSSTYPSPLTIAMTGAIEPTAAAATALVATISGGYVLNLGTVAGGDGASGGIGLDQAAGTLTNRGRISGGSASSSGGVGGLGAEVANASLSNAGTARDQGARALS